MKCAVEKCKQNNSKKSNGRKSISYYSFPKDETQRKLWVKFCKRKNTVNAQRERICTLHFTDEDFERNLKYEMGFTNKCALKLKPGAIPTIETTDTANDVETNDTRIESIIYEDENTSITIDSNKDLERKIDELKQENCNLKKIQNQSAITIQNLSSQVQRLSFTNAYLEKALGRLYTEGQIKKLKNGGKCRDAKTLEIKEVRVSMLGKAVYEWIRRMMYYKDILITDGLIQKMALQFKSAMGVKNFFPHQEWCDNFRSAYNISTCDSKMLNIGYTQGYSVQIKDVMKDVLSECSPDHDEDNGDEVEFIEDGDDEDNGNCENDCISIHSDKGEIKVKTMLRKKITDKNVQKKPTNEASSKTVQIMPHTQLQSLRQLVALPIHANGLSQKVLVATPIVAPGQKQGSTPMTMTIIPLVSLAQPSNAVNTTTTSVTTASSSHNNNNNNINNYAKDQQVVVPPPILEIKKEIKEEAKDDYIVEKCQDGVIEIKNEYLTDDEDVADTPAKQQQTQLPALQSNTPAHIVAIPLDNKDMIEESTNDSLDDLTLSTLRKRIKLEQPLAEQNSPIDRNSSPLPSISPPLISRPVEISPMLSLTKASTETNTITTATSLPKDTAAPSFTPLPPSNLSSHKRQRADENQPTLPSIRSYAEGRKYLKLLEDFALERENFRLIGLTTRADDVLKEFDRKENNEDEDADIDYYT